MFWRGWFIFPMRKNSKGVITLVLLWGIILFVLVIIGLTFRSYLEMKMVGMSEERSRAYLAGWAGIQRVMEILRNDDPAIDSFQDFWAKEEISGEVETGKFKVEIIYDEERFIDLNFADEPLLKRVFGNDPVLVPSLLDWRDENEVPRPNGAESNYYAQFGYQARNGFLRNSYEINWIRGGERFRDSLPAPDGPGMEALFEIKGLDCHPHNPPQPPRPGDPDWEPHPPLPRIPPGVPDPTIPPPAPPRQPGEPITYAEYTVYGDGLNNLNTATFHVLVALGFYPSLAEKIVAYRNAGYFFTHIDTQYIAEELRNKKIGCSPEEEANLRWVVNTGRLKVNSSFFRVIIRDSTHRK
ncbi:MAG: type II secretion system protein GspK [Candidatus Omnitrophica bacterium]|nr:type II secretion system protein GspK [Candidatus Omnitrophota bacterium]